jgi:hypothetical protein
MSYKKWAWSKFICTAEKRGNFDAFCPDFRFRNVHCVGFKTDPLQVVTITDGFTLETEDIELAGPEFDGHVVQGLLYKVKETYTEDGVLLPKDFEIVDERGRERRMGWIVWEGEIYLPLPE